MFCAVHSATPTFTRYKSLLPDSGKSSKKLKYCGRKKLFTERKWDGISAEIAEK
jgi:hypothetical protein